MNILTVYTFDLILFQKINIKNEYFAKFGFWGRERQIGLTVQREEVRDLYDGNWARRFIHLLVN